MRHKRKDEVALLNLKMDYLIAILEKNFYKARALRIHIKDMKKRMSSYSNVGG